MPRTSIIPTLRYKNAAAAADWLCHAFGFHKKLVLPHEDGSIAHAQLVYGDGMIMLSSESASEYGKLVAVPRDLDNIVTQSPYIIVQDAEMESHYCNSKKAGAVIAIELRKDDYGGQAYSCFDPEGHLWNFGSYDPWVETEVA